MAFRVGQCHYKGEDYVDAATAFDDSSSVSPMKSSVPKLFSGAVKAIGWVKRTARFPTLQSMPLGLPGKRCRQVLARQVGLARDA